MFARILEVSFHLECGMLPCRLERRAAAEHASPDDDVIGVRSSTSGPTERDMTLLHRAHTPSEMREKE